MASFGFLVSSASNFALWSLPTMMLRLPWFTDAARCISACVRVPSIKNTDFCLDTLAPTISRKALRCFASRSAILSSASSSNSP